VETNETFWTPEPTSPPRQAHPACPEMMPQRPLTSPFRALSTGLAAASWLALGTLLLGTPGCAQEPFLGPYKHVLLISLDTTRADHLGCYGNLTASTPHLDALAAEGTLFNDVVATATTTLSSHTSIMTGLYPRRHGVARNGFMVNQENRMLAEVLSGAGFHTAGFLGSYALDRMFDFNQGFDAWDQEFDIEFSFLHADQNQRRGEDVTDAVLDHLDELDGDERLFLFAHYFDAHAPYDPPAPFGARFVPEGQPVTSNIREISLQEALHHQRSEGQQHSVYDLGLTRSMAAFTSDDPLPGDRLLASLYAAEIAYMDGAIGRLLAGLDKRGLLEDCVVLVIADHGETFWEHGDAWHHGAWVFDTNVRVPLILRLPDGRGAGKQVTGLASGTDVFPTLLELLDIDLPEEVDGISLMAALDGAPLPERAVFSEATQPVLGVEQAGRWLGQFKPRAVRRGPWKYIEAPYIEVAQLFNLRSDPFERHNLLLHPSPRSQVELPILKQALDAWSAHETPRPSRFNTTQADEVRQRLEALGYTGKDKSGAAEDD
jgi:arylsulfatase A-like enzyme